MELTPLLGRSTNKNHKHKFETQIQDCAAFDQTEFRCNEGGGEALISEEWKSMRKARLDLSNQRVFYVCISTTAERRKMQIERWQCGVCCIVAPSTRS